MMTKPPAKINAARFTVRCLLHSHSLECPPFLCHLIHKFAGLRIYFSPAFVARRKHLRTTGNLAFPAVTLFCIFRHGAIISLASRLPDTDELELVEKPEYIERKVVPDGSAHKKFKTHPDRDRCE